MAPNQCFPSGRFEDEESATQHALSHSVRQATSVFRRYSSCCERAVSTGHSFSSGVPALAGRYRRVAVRSHDSPASKLLFRWLLISRWPLPKECQRMAWFHPKDVLPFASFSRDTREIVLTVPPSLHCAGFAISLSAGVPVRAQWRSSARGTQLVRCATRAAARSSCPRPPLLQGFSVFVDGCAYDRSSSYLTYPQLLTVWLEFKRIITSNDSTLSKSSNQHWDVTYCALVSSKAGKGLTTYCKFNHS
jgi:hypothetical protein